MLLITGVGLIGFIRVLSDGTMNRHLFVITGFDNLSSDEIEKHFHKSVSGS